MSTRNSQLDALGLSRNPFPYTPDAQCYYWTPHLEEQVTELVHCIESRKGFLLLTAEVGMGKSTLVRRLMANLESANVVSAMVFNTFLQGPELLAAVLQDFGLESTGTMATDIGTLNEFLLANHRDGKTCLLIIDDAQNLSDDSLELIRLLCNLETDVEKLLQILLVGQPELEDSLAKHSLRQLRSRLVMHSRLQVLGSTELADYVRFRLSSAGDDNTIAVNTDACQRLWRETQGVPRRVHQIMDRCLYGLVARNTRVIDDTLMQAAIEDSRVTLTGPAPVDTPPVTNAGKPAANGSPWAWVAAGAFLAMTGFAVWQKLNLPGQAHAAAVAPPAKVQTNGQATAPSAPDNAQESSSGAAAAEGADSATATTATEAPARMDSCDDASHVWPEGHMVVSQPLGETTLSLMGERLAQLDDACMSERNGQTWMTWSTPTAGYALTDRITAARLQIALTHYGSLLPSDVDGVWGSRSRAGLMQFQSSLGIAPTGEMDPISGLLLEKFYVNTKQP
ncbi:AAA family ATPase [Hydrogenophaga sp. 5NK40-0174]|uniref:ExeA family protein n=1 Tax=Hydrogenophaga sp. 5NK40-0174 TaxID=3127649 RepID=UPI0031020813